MLTLKRITSGGRFIPQIDGLRFIAIMSVIVIHIHALLGQGHGVPKTVELVPYTETMHMLSKRGVYLFFVISGFILGTPFAQMYINRSGTVNLKSYFKRRLTRLEPPYILCMIICTFVLVSRGTLIFREALPHLLAGLGYAHAIFYDGQNNPINGVTWSLEVEIQFYILVPLLTLLYRIQGRGVRRTVLITSILTSSWCSLHLLYFPIRIVYAAPFFLAGLLIADIHSEFGELWKGANSYAWDGVALLGWPFVWIPAEPAAHLALPLLFIVLVIAAFRGRLVSRLLSLPFVTSIGGMCYSIYLFHFYIISACEHRTESLTLGIHSYILYFILQSAIVLPVVLVICGLFFVLIERPCMNPRWPQQLALAFQTIVRRNGRIRLITSTLGVKE